MASPAIGALLAAAALGLGVAFGAAPVVGFLARLPFGVVTGFFVMADFVFAFDFVTFAIGAPRPRLQ
ncbi:MAG TPA: hypothetical protein VGR62_20365 [Candidatus Binatia bacterium]|jgi:hypothetical protein|nr:hypothetical protein [Candidatus Binatia bacterium]